MVDLAAALDEVLRQRRSLRDAVLILFGRGWPIKPEAVKRALVSYLDSVEIALTKAISKSRSREAMRASLSTTKSGRAMLRHLDEAGFDETSFVNMVDGLSGRRDGWVRDLMAASGFRVIVANLFDDETLRALDDVLGQFSIISVRNEVQAAHPEQLAQAVQDAQSILPLVSAFTELLARFANKPDVLLLHPETELDAELDIAHWSAVALWARNQGLDLDVGVALAIQAGPAVTAMVELAGEFSYARGPLFGPDSERELAKLHDYERESIVERIEGWLEREPERANAIRSLSSS